MKRSLVALCLASIAAWVYAAPPEFDGVATSQGINYFAVRQDLGMAMKWVKLGDSAGDYVLKAYDKHTETLTLLRNGESIQVVLKVGGVRSAPKAEPTIELLNGLIEKGDVGKTVILDVLTSMRDRRDDSARELAEAEARAVKEPEPRRSQLVIEYRRKFELEEANLEYYTDQTIAYWRHESRSSK